MAWLYCLPDNKRITFAPRESILKLLLNADIPQAHACGGHARCSTCRISIESGLENCSPRTSVEKEMSDRLQLPTHVRLACQTQLQGDVMLRRLVLDSDDIDIAWSQLETGSIGEEKRLAILFADIRGFTHFSETMLPYDVIYILNRYFRSMDQVIREYDGVINNYMGDGLMALFGLDTPENAAENAIKAGWHMLQAVDHLNRQLTILQDHPLRIGVGIHYGPVVIGGIGHGEKPFITAIGDTVNTASRIEAANKTLGTTMLISEVVYLNTHSMLRINQCKEIALPGKSGLYRLYEVVPNEVVPIVMSEVVRKKQYSWWERLKQWFFSFLGIRKRPKK